MRAPRSVNSVALQNFISDFRLQDCLVDSESKNLINSLMKSYNVLLSWQLVLNLSDVEDDQLDNEKLYFLEMLSDAAHCNFSLVSSLYRSGRLYARSTIENLYRVCALSQGADISSSQFTHQLIALTRETNLWLDQSPISSDLNYLYSVYGDLCRYVHSHSRSYMSLRIPFGNIAIFSKENFKNLCTLLKDIFQRMNRVLFWIYRERLAQSHYVHRDHILGNLPASLKRAVYG